MNDRDKIELYSASYAGLAWKFQVNPKSCGNYLHYEEYIRLNAITDNASGRATTHVFIREIEGRETLLGYITLRAASYIEILEEQTYGYPALEIFELAVHKDYEGCGIGSKLIKFAFAKAYELNKEHIGIQYITLCADENAVSFYKDKWKFGRIDEYGKIPRDNWNVNCIPMFIKLPERMN